MTAHIVSVIVLVAACSARPAPFAHGEGSGKMYCEGAAHWPASATPCRSDADCGGGAQRCYADGPPAPSPCGACREAPRECERDADCGAGRCAPATDPCFCAPGTRCVARCTPTSCADGEACGDDGTCQPLACSAGYTCRPGWRCDPAASVKDPHGCAQQPCWEGGGCGRNQTCTAGAGCDLRRCTRDMDCDCGACVAGTCRDRPGICGVPPAHAP